MVPVLFMWLPSLLIGSFGARYLAIESAYRSVGHLLESMDDATLTGHFSLINTFILWLVLSLVTLVIFGIGVEILSNQSVLDLLQGKMAIKVWRKSKNNEKESEYHRKAYVYKDKEKAEEKYIENDKERDALTIDYIKQGNEAIKCFPQISLDEKGLSTTPKQAKKAIRCQIYRYIFRMPVKTILTLGLAVMFVVAIGLLEQGIEESIERINYLYDNTIVTATIQNEDRFIWPFPYLTVGAATVEMVVDTGFVKSYYLESGIPFIYLVPQKQIEHLDGRRWIWHNPVADEDTFYNFIHGFTDIEVFLEEHRSGILELIAGPGGEFIGISEDDLVQFHFGANYQKSDFAFNEAYLTGNVIPVIVGEYVLRERDLKVGESAYVISHWNHIIQEVYIIGSATNWAMAQGREFWAESAVFLPISTIEMLRANDWRGMFYESALFKLDPGKNRELSHFREAFQKIEENTDGHFVQKRFELHDDELRLTVEPLEQTLSLLQILYPVVIGVSLLVALGLSILLCIQNAKNAAVMRVLGLKKSKTREVLVLIQMVVSFVGLVLGLALLSFMGGILDLSSPPYFFAGAYLLAIFIGSTIGAMIVSNKPVLELLQVKE